MLNAKEVMEKIINLISASAGATKDAEIKCDQHID